MASTIIHIACEPGTTDVYATSVGGSGSAASSYTPTQLAGRLHKITVSQNLTGDWYFGAGNADGDRGWRVVYGLTNEAKTYTLTLDNETALIDIINDLVDGGRLDQLLDTIKNEILKIPRAGSSLPAGGNFSRNKVSISSDELTERLTS